MGEAGLAQGDIATYYDKLNCLRIAYWMGANGLGLFWAAAFLRIQMLPRVRLSAGGASSFLIADRSCGSLTGSRSAVAAGRVPVESVACKLAPQWRTSGVRTNSMTIMFSSWVDNYYAFGQTLHDALHIAESFEHELFRGWGLSIKPSSRSVLSPVRPAEAWDQEKWPRVEEAEVLGHIICSSTSPWPCWRRTQRNMWASFWRNCVGPQARALSINDRCRLLDRAVKPVLTFRNTRWPWTHSLSDCQNRLQRQMLSYFVRVERYPCEEINRFHRRRSRSIATLAKARGLWGVQHAERVLAWADHLRRERNSHSLAAALFTWRDHNWLSNRRQDPDVGSGIGRPGTRLLPGPVVKRWDESLEGAHDYWQSQQ